MSSDTLKATADTLVRYCREDKTEQGLDELYAEDAVSVEAGPSPDGTDPVSKGLDAIRAKHKWWNDNFEVHGGDVDGPMLHGDDRFAVIFDVDATHRESGQRNKMREVGIYTVGKDGKIVREEFFYAM